jgi:cyclophilin family peptidyl-prolyl cis-trans isomerase
VSFLKSIPRFAAAALLAAAAWLSPAQATMVRMHTAYGPIDVNLYDEGAPITVANFLGYVRKGAFSDTFIHRSVRDFVIQGGWSVWPENAATNTFIPTDPPIVLEYSASRPNARGTIAMARTSQLNSATSQFFFNTADNTVNLGPTNGGGYAAFGMATTPSLAAIDAIAGLRIVNAGATFPTLPVRNWTTGPILREHLAIISRVEEMPAPATLSDSDRIFNYLEAAVPQYAAPASQPSATFEGYYYRHYPATGAYAGTKDGQLYYLVPSISSEIQHAGSVADWLAAAQAAGY